MSKTVGDFVIERLSDWGITRIFGFPGDGINGLMGSLDRADGKIDFIQTRHEENAAFMACAHAKFTGEVGICMATSGPGAIHLLNGLYDAKLDHQPVVAIVGQSATTAMGGSFQQEVDLNSLYKDVAHEYVHTLMDPSQTRTLIDRAIRIAKIERTVTCVIIPNNLQDEKYEEPARVHNSIHTSLHFTYPQVVPNNNDLQKAADILNEGKKVAMLIGAGAQKAAYEVMEVAELLGAGVAKALLGKDVLPDDISYVTGAIGLLGTKPSWDLMMDCDTLLMVGSSFPYSEFLPKEGQARGIQIDINGKMLGIRYPMELNLQGDSKETLKALIPLLKRKEDRSWREEIEKNVAEWWKVIEARAMNRASPINPERIFWELSSRLPDNCILSSDSGTSADWFARDIKIRKGMRASLSGNLATMCPGVPYAIAAKFAHPERVSIAMVGDGAMQMLGNNGLITISKYWKRWSDPRMIIVVLNNRDLNQVTWEQRVMEGDPKFEASQDVPDFPYAEYARMLGLDGIKVDEEKDIVYAIEEALASRKPVVLEAYTDPSVPPLPPHISFKQAKAFMSSMVKGDANAWDMIKQSWKDVIENFIPHKEKEVSETV
ncbi:MAG: thiamine pyrophosphate-requiring protein [Ginsengibacter sp.]